MTLTLTLGLLGVVLASLAMLAPVLGQVGTSEQRARERVKQRGKILSGVTQNFDDITVSDNGDSAEAFEEILDLTPDSAGIEYVLFDGMKFRLDPDDSGNSDLPDDSELQYVVQGPLEERGNEHTIDEVELQRFNNVAFSDQFDEANVFRLGISTPDGIITIEEDFHFKLVLRGSTAISWSDSDLNMELGEVS